MIVHSNNCSACISWQGVASGPRLLHGALNSGIGKECEPMGDAADESNILLLTRKTKINLTENIPDAFLGVFVSVHGPLV